MCEFKRVEDPQRQSYRYEVWSPNGKVGDMWGQDLDVLDLVIAGLFYQDPQIEELTKGSGMDTEVETLFRRVAEIGRTHRHP